MQFRIGPIGLVALLATGLGACSSDIFSRDLGGFQKVEFFKLRDDSRVAATKDFGLDTNRPVAPDDLVDGSGLCAGMASAAVDPVGPDGAVTPASAPAAPAASTVVGGVALGMTECEVVRRAGAPGKVEMGADAANERSIVLTYMSGNWPGIYRFSGGRLKEVERVAAPPPPPKPVAKKKLSLIHI